MCQKVSSIPSVVCVPTASSCLLPVGCRLLLPALGLRRPSEWLQRREARSNIFHGFIPSKQRLYLPTSHGCRCDCSATREGQSPGLPSPHLSSKPKEVGNQRFEAENSYGAPQPHTTTAQPPLLPGGSLCRDIASTRQRFSAQDDPKN